MSDLSDTAHRSTIAAQGLATMGADPVWDRRVAAFLAWEARSSLQEKYGEVARNRDALDLDRVHLEAQYGKDWRQNPAAQKEWARIRAAEEAQDEMLTERCYRPFWQSQRDLVLTPAPTLAATLFKALVAQYHEVWNDSGFDGDCAAIVDAELARFCGEPE